MLVVLWRWINGLALTDPEKRATTQLDALKLAASIVVGGGGLFALYLAARRQHTQELELDARQVELEQRDRVQAHAEQVAETNRLHAERIAADTYADAAARRITDLYAKSVEQLGSDKAPVRLGGLYALERLAQDNIDRPTLRQTVVNVLCAYLRMPFTLPGDRPADDAEEQIRDRYDERVQEREVRLTAQRILTAHLEPGPTPEDAVDTFWPNTDLDLSGATLIELNLNHCRIRQARFLGARMVGPARLVRATFDGPVLFGRAVFDILALFDGVTFARDVSFGDTRFGGRAAFDQTTFGGFAGFDRATFAHVAIFADATFAGSTSFNKTKFTDGVAFNGAVTAHPVSDRPAWPIGWRPANERRPAEGREGTWYHLVRGTSGNETISTSGG